MQENEQIIAHNKQTSIDKNTNNTMSRHKETNTHTHTPNCTQSKTQTNTQKLT